MPDVIVVPDATDPNLALAAVVALRRRADRLEIAAVDEAVAQGWTWAAIAEALGVSRQAVHKRHARRVARTRTEGA
ncbi:helix-turn-helix domain-containing protein [Euzebya rosea]|uniref:helix-turn-helix domain-containing protein n=1 Tax=Euzebya rosea TaxID=2052804 RepID=UPI000D3E6C0D|nr:helix-turn-helix domain-containing protein [Euzebya rosea]